MNPDRLRIQSFLISFAKEFEGFFGVGYSKDTGLPSLRAQKIFPASVLCNETGVTYGPDRKAGRKVSRVPTGWRFELSLKFNEEAYLDNFQKEMLEKVPSLLSGGGYSSVLLNLLSADISHPPQQSPNSGTSVTYSVEANVGRN